MNVAILGFGKQGKSAAEYWGGKGDVITVCDENEPLEVSQGYKAKLGADYLRGLDEFDLIVRSPSIHPRSISQANSETILEKVTSVTNEFFKVSPTKNIIGVTGTKGKGTTSTLIARMLEAAGKKVHLGGNIGTPPLELLKNNINSGDWVVLELANYQLIDLKYSPNIGVCVMVVPEHLDWHKSMDEYVNAKKQLFARQDSTDTAVYFAGNSASKIVASAGNGQLIPYFEKPGAIIENGEIRIGEQSICKTGEVKLPGEHNLQNICAAVTVINQIIDDYEAMRGVITSFIGLKHRLELVSEIDGVKYYDDSFGTTPETAIVAVKAFSQPKILIAGGRGKGVPFDKLAAEITRNNVKKAIAIGETGPEISELLKARGYKDVVQGGASIEEIVAQARELAEPGDVVLLSTANASFDMFDNYEDRGSKFAKAVQSLA